MKNAKFKYYVEGQNEEKLITVLKNEALCLAPGSIDVLNVIKKRITNAKLMRLN